MTAFEHLIGMTVEELQARFRLFNPVGKAPPRHRGVLPTTLAIIVTKPRQKISEISR